ncbi:MAG: hypothetical protein K2M47_05380 [Clostridiales bacterium]|nr:hypothetical protein [Clostridiales bacterium]
MGNWRKWNITICSQSYFVSTIDGEEKYFFVGYDNGIKEKKEELYFLQREKDKEKYQIAFSPKPHFISYSFFYGFFNDTITKMCSESDTTHSFLSQKNIILNKFFEKYAFDVDEIVNAQIKEYVMAIIEKNIDIQDGVGIKNGIN